jgi:hypothetical protein
MGWVGQGQHLFYRRRFLRSKKRNLAAATPEAERSAFATGQEARAGRAFISPQPPFLPAPPERSVLVSAARSAAINRDFAQKKFALRSVIATKREKRGYIFL